MCVRYVPLFEVRVDHSIGETFTTDTDTLKYTVTGKLVHDKVSIDDTCREEK